MSCLVFFNDPVLAIFDELYLAVFAGPGHFDIIHDNIRRILHSSSTKMYELYHTEAITNAFMDIDSLIATGNPAW